MSVERLVVVHCNVCGVGVEFDSWGHTAEETRFEAKEYGWKVGLPGGVDLCPEHLGSAS